MELILSLARKNLAETVDPAERAQKSLAFEQLMANAQMDMATDAPATIVIREHFVSVYWYDHIRAENLSEELLEYAALQHAPFLLNALKKALSCDTGERMAAVFEAETGLSLFLDEAACGKRGMKALHRWGNAVVFRAST